MTFAEFMWGVACMVFGYTMSNMRQHILESMESDKQIKIEHDEYFRKIKEMSESKTNPFDDYSGR